MTLPLLYNICNGGSKHNLPGGIYVSSSYINVRYTRENYGIITRRFLGELIVTNKIIQFYRESEKKWVTIGVDPIRSMNIAYSGLERRAH